MPLSTIEEGIEEIRNGRPVILVDEDSPDSDGFFCLAAEKVTAQSLNYLLQHGRGIIYVTLIDERIRELGIPMIAEENSRLAGLLCGASFSVRLEGVHGVSAQGRAHTIQAAIADSTKHEDLVIPGHVQPLQARSGGVLARSGRTDASVDLARLAGFKPAGAICQILADDGSVAILPALQRLAQQEGLKIVSVADLIAHRLRNESLVRRVAEEEFPTIHGGMYRAIVFRNEVDGLEHMALVKGDISHAEQVLVRVHSECLTGDVFGSERCDCGDQIRQSLRLIDEQGRGVLIYMHQEGRGIGLTNKIKAYALQDQGRDTVEANLELGFKEDLRDYGIGAQILRELGVEKISLLTNNPRKITGLEVYGVKVVERVPLEVQPRDTTIHYLRTKQTKLGHLLTNLESKPAKG
ncbi:MAG: GTP cyclohydrolase II [Deltaproteobacteria bacterium]|jgi:3,4-dihydroxy 2-butanone 4-phosphate synthase/GTP cyclohydrolase II|nr:MAG: GTP cyclohydrolase II [Deltaproteobacteria bacterium]